MLRLMISVVIAAAMVASAAEPVRYEALSDGCPIVVTGTELRGEQNVARGQTIALKGDCESTRVRFRSGMI